MMSPLRNLLRRIAWPSYECECCVGQEAWQGCYCWHHGGTGPGVGPEHWRCILRRALDAVGWGWTS
jgi:hypothetical protein